MMKNDEENNEKVEIHMVKVTDRNIITAHQEEQKLYKIEFMEI
jgi:hypothetical protein